jgi:hypothetical protein
MSAALGLLAAVAADHYHRDIDGVAHGPKLFGRKPDHPVHFLTFRHLYPSVAKVGGLQSQGAKGAAVVNLLQALGNAGSCVLRLSRRVRKMA